MSSVSLRLPPPSSGRRYVEDPTAQLSLAALDGLIAKSAGRKVARPARPMPVGMPAPLLEIENPVVSRVLSELDPAKLAAPRVNPVAEASQVRPTGRRLETLESVPGRAPGFFHRPAVRRRIALAGMVVATTGLAWAALFFGLISGLEIQRALPLTLAVVPALVATLLLTRGLTRWPRWLRRLVLPLFGVFAFSSTLLGLVMTSGRASFAELASVSRTNPTDAVSWLVHHLSASTGSLPEIAGIVVCAMAGLIATVCVAIPSASARG